MPHVLLIEDDEDIREVFEIVLGERFRVTVAASGQRGLALAACSSPDVVLVDWTLPDLDGDEVVRGLRALPSGGRPLAIVIVSGASELRAIAARLGVLACPKPCDADKLIAAVDAALLSRR